MSFKTFGENLLNTNKKQIKNLRFLFLSRFLKKKKFKKIPKSAPKNFHFRAFNHAINKRGHALKHAQNPEGSFFCHVF